MRGAMRKKTACKAVRNTSVGFGGDDEKPSEGKRLSGWDMRQREGRARVNPLREDTEAVGRRQKDEALKE